MRKNAKKDQAYLLVYDLPGNPWLHTRERMALSRFLHEKEFHKRRIQKSVFLFPDKNDALILQQTLQKLGADCKLFPISPPSPG